MARLRANTALTTLIVGGDVRVGQPGSADERGGADVGAAVLVGAPTVDLPGLAEIIAYVGQTEEILDRWRLPGADWGSSWEERFGFERYAALIRSASARVLDDAGVAQADHVVVVSPNTAVAKRASTLVKGVLSTSGSPVGFAGAVDPLIAVADVLDRAGPNETILLVSAADGVDALVLRTTGALSAAARPTGPAAQLAKPSNSVAYPRYLAWRGILEFEPPRRPEPARPAGAPSARAVGWKYGFVGSRCLECGFIHLPPARVCRECGTADAGEPMAAATLAGRVATFTVDHLAYSPSPPVVVAVIDFDGGGRTTLEVADARPDVLAIGDRVELVFRRLYTAEGVHNYFWKAIQVDENPIDDSGTREG
ncbi:OB-fold domain-containing protein [Gordonia sp. ABSL1-1]|uniref:OB-fold domain-containing protein n=1 Tax=Gordonia sp. ABSL1-1 TaxID=3053923 RepID=UPI00257235FF|nr:OB-fold domain-containing protein [Gordonia sp. ABSL1-1]MDL9938921.1 OB-fold domain-containing protein [Gordonia sp. ABSL1-1]